MQKAVRFIILMGLVSLFGDMTYEGARSVVGPYLATFGVSAALLGFVVGVGELSGFALRLVSGYVADRTKRYWAMTFIGYGLILAIPLLALANQWEIAALLIVLERTGKAIRSPARDAILSFATKQVGRGWGFGIHEALDQIGAIIGPLIFFAVFYLNGGYREGFAILLIPAILALLTLSFARVEYPSPHTLEAEFKLRDRKLPRTFWLYTLFIFLSMAGFANFQIISYHLKTQSIISDAFIPIIYAIAMGVDALAALATGKAYDKVGLKSLTLVPVITPLILLSFSHSWTLALIGIVAWGIAMGMQETIMRAAVADLVGAELRSTAYGIFNTAYGVAFFAGSVAVGLFYDISVRYLIAYVILAELAALLLLKVGLERAAWEAR
ncbi:MULTISPECIES: MFS transporter [unclassified Archaeoglobus]|jgi:MFS family permease|uniref:MFS transporter n=1 Tax=unclassified Archaeoglobus TaxID=2643606 RepID=UPI0025BAD164|nr:MULTISPECIES: MFS transporter [unclassified Archaeoglobus]